jgi:hypothetical protein
MAFDALYNWNFNSALAGVRGPQALAILPDAERADWQAFWAEYERVRESHKIKP